MSNLISCQNLSKGFTARPLFEDLTFGLFENERTGLIGPNGAGKSTLLKILAGLETPDTGKLNTRRGLRVQYLAQRDFFSDASDGLTVREELTKALTGLDLEDYEIDIRVEAGMKEAGFTPEQKVSALSGGWRKRLAILSQVLCQPDLLLLDEPTNHLDLEGVRWLEKFLNSLTFSFLVITHDRRFLESVCNRVIELNKKYKEGHFSSKGNYSDFLENREKLFLAQQAQEDSTRNTVRREMEWLRRGPKARTTKQKARIDRAGKLMDDLKDLEFRNAQDRTASIDFTASDRRSKVLIDAREIHMSRGGKKLFGPLDLMINPGSRIGLLGENGSGKSTLLKLLSDELRPTSGSIKRAHALKVVTFDQHREQLNMDLPLRRALCDSGDKVIFRDRAIHVIGWAERFLFSKKQLDMPLKQLSGGEQARVLIARLMLRPADVLLLDEPTNDLDLGSLEVLERSMNEFTGGLVLVTHDRYLLDRVCDTIVSLDGNGKARIFADLAQWEMAQDQQTPSLKREEKKKKESKPKKGLSRQQSKELKRIEANIRQSENAINKAKLALEDPSISSNAEELVARQETLKEKEDELEKLLIQWEELEEKR